MNHGNYPDSRIEEVAPSTILKWMSENEAIVIDVREPDEYAREHIAGAVLLPLSRFDPKATLSLISSGRKLVVHCRAGVRGMDAAKRLAACAAPGQTIFNMAGGLQAWKATGNPIESNSSASRISIMRQVQLVVGIIVLIGSALAWFIDPRFIGIPAFFGAGLTFAGSTGMCALASLLGLMPWNRVVSTTCSAGACAH